MPTISRDAPLNEITLRRYEKPYDLKGRDLTKKFCLSLGLLQPADSRDIIVDILQVLIKAKKEKKLLTSEEIKELTVGERKNKNLPLKGIASSNVRRQLKRLKDLFIVECINNQYRITEFEDISILFEKKIEKFFIPMIIERIKDYLNAMTEQ